MLKPSQQTEAPNLFTKDTQKKRMYNFIDIRRNISLKTRIIVLAGFVVLCSIAGCLYSMISFEKLFALEEASSKQHNEQTTELNTLSSKIKDLLINEKTLLIETGSAQRFEAEKKTESILSDADDCVRKIESFVSSKSEISAFNTFFKEYQKLIEINREIIKLSNSKADTLAKQLSAATTKSNYNTISRKLDILYKEIEKRKTNEAASIEAQKAETKSSIIKALGVVIFLSLLISFVFIRDFHFANAKLQTALRKFEKGKFQNKKLPEHNDEIGQISASYNRIFSHLNELTQFASEISKGNYDTDFSKLSNEDELGNALLDLQKSLKETREAERKRKIEDDHRNWVNKGLAMFSDIARQNSYDAKELSYHAIKQLVKYVKANQCCIFLLKSNKKEEDTLELTAAIAFDRRKHAKKTIRIGDGLIGTCAVEKQSIHLKQIPEDYILIGSGLGESKPSSLLLVPLKIENQVFGVIEIASFNEFTAQEVSFIEKVAENISTSISSATANERTEQLLKETKQQSETLIRQDEATRLQLEELHAKQESMQKTYADMQNILNAVDSAIIKAEYDISGTLISANALYLSTIENRLDEVKGQNVKKFVPEEKLEKFNQYWQNLCNGIPYDGIMRHYSKSGKDIWMDMSYTPIKDGAGNVVKILFLATNVTKTKKSELDILNKKDKLETELKESLQRLHETKNKYHIQLEKEISANKELEDTNLSYKKEIEQMLKTWKGQLKKAIKWPTELENYRLSLKEKEKEIDLLKTRFEINTKNIPLEAEKLFVADKAMLQTKEWLDKIENKKKM